VLAGVDRTEEVLRRRRLLVEVERHGLAVAHQPEPALRQPDLVGLEAVAQPGLGDAPSVLDVVDQGVQVRPQVTVQRPDVRGGDAAEEDPAEAGRGVHRQVLAAQGHPSGRRDRA
jgi:hypothetical protein